MSTPAKQLPASPHVTAVVVVSGKYEAQIGTDKGIVIQKIGPQNGRSKVIELTASEATQLLDLVAHGREVLRDMDRQKGTS